MPTTRIDLEWDAIPSQDPRDYSLHPVMGDKTKVSTLHLNLPPDASVDGALTYAIDKSVRSGTVLYFEVSELDPSCQLRKPDP